MAKVKFPKMRINFSKLSALTLNLWTIWISLLYKKWFLVWTTEHKIRCKPSSTTSKLRKCSKSLTKKAASIEMIWLTHCKSLNWIWTKLWTWRHKAMSPSWMQSLSRWLERLSSLSQGTTIKTRHWENLNLMRTFSLWWKISRSTAKI